MIKKSIIVRNFKRKFLCIKRSLRNKFYVSIRNATNSFNIFLKCRFEIQKFERNSFFNRYRNRCNITGRGRGVYPFFGFSRHVLKELASQNSLSGVRKSSW